MTGTEALAWAVIALAGAAIGATSIGGVLVVPALSSLLGVPLPEAIAASSLAFLVTGAYALTGKASGALAHLQRDAPLMLTALLGAGAGAALAAWAPGDAVRGWIGLLALASGAHALWRLHRPYPRADHPWPGLGGQIALGLGVGLGSALSGTGGPVMLLPILMLMRRPLSRAIVAAQVIQLPIAVAASGAHALAGRLDWRLGATIAVALLLGAWAGRRLARRANPRPLQAATAAVLLATGAWFLLA
ncbi:MAG: TSUP family transporter [Hydrogenophaga sp.]|uniref:sulfite exporter TauE/SafE family protein n=1 Tax=Hydrogenophaga sp. TaxID=1904254 RepID=UPI0016916FA0|nr:sulfite exporter TauE/SafE family protein [Hydrogenophaga sp.]NIM40333.1 TSUP family transporter [Hydrogenophaga sp.]NIN25564.1 TSUP family transporter [Hydrogenophaga sp.]NIN30216.1 TSUP family transporter [Hydrogenophaga sp.]NIN54517.1 TSUP family transporter [Hydrogenophaga sp.]NIO50390.1 TSUP family transporter [Hydrogenophaga sp.]